MPRRPSFALFLFPLILILANTLAVSACESTELGGGACDEESFGDAALPDLVSDDGGGVEVCGNGGVPPDCELITDAERRASRLDASTRPRRGADDAGEDAGLRETDAARAESSREADAVDAVDARGRDDGATDATVARVGPGVPIAR
jgi:hypothetical protein